MAKQLESLFVDYQSTGPEGRFAARDIFEVGMHVCSTPEFIQFGLSKIPRTGVVVGFGKEWDIVRVDVDGQKTHSRAYHMNFWRPAKAVPCQHCKGLGVLLETNPTACERGKG